MRWVLESKAVLDSCAYNSVLAITVDERNKRSPQVYIFQCEETGVRGACLLLKLNACSALKVLLSFFSQAEVIKADLDKVLGYRGGLADNDGGVEPRTAQPDIKYAWTHLSRVDEDRTTLNECACLCFSGLTSRTSSGKTSGSLSPTSCHERSPRCRCRTSHRHSGENQVQVTFL